MASLTRTIRRAGRRWQPAFALLFAAMSFSFLKAAESREFQIKAAALYNVVAFTEWPTTSFGFANTPLVVGLWGHDATAALLAELIANERWQGRRIVARRVQSLDEMRSCHVLYVARPEHARWSSVAGQFAALPVLTVSDAPDFARRGGIVELTIRANKLRLVVNLNAAQRAGVAISSKVLRLADVISDRGP